MFSRSFLQGSVTVVGVEANVDEARCPMKIIDELISTLTMISRAKYAPVVEEG